MHSSTAFVDTVVPPPPPVVAPSTAASAGAGAATPTPAAAAYYSTFKAAKTATGLSDDGVDGFSFLGDHTSIKIASSFDTASLLDDIGGDDFEPVPGPPPLLRVSGHPTVFNTFSTTWTSQAFPSTPALNDPALLSGGLFADYAGSTAASAAAASAEQEQHHRLLYSTCRHHPPHFAATDSSTFDGYDHALVPPYPVLGSSPPMMGSLLVDAPSDDRYPKGLNAINPDRIVHTTKGLAVLLNDQPAKVVMMAPSLPAPPSEPTVATALTPTAPRAAAKAAAAKPSPAATTIASSRRFKHWTQDEDALLKTAISLEGGPPHNWTLISRKYFHGSRNPCQCKGRWTKVQYSSCSNVMCA